MPVTLSIVGATSDGVCSMQLGALPDGASSVQVQYSSRADFKYVPTWFFNLYASTATQYAPGFNQSSAIYLRARALLANGRYDAWSAVQPAYFPQASPQVFSPAAVQIAPALIVVPHTVLMWAASSEVAGYPVRALGRDDPGSMWMATTANNVAVIRVQLSGSPIDTIAILEANIPEGMYAVVQADTSIAGVESGSPAYSFNAGQLRPSANVPGRRAYHGLIRLPAPQAYPFWRIALIGACPGNVFGATYACFGRARFAKNISAGKSENVVDAGTLSRDRMGNANRTIGLRGRTVDFDLGLLTPAEYEQQFSELRNRVGLTEPVLVIPNAAAGPYLHDRMLYGALTASQNANPYTARFNQSFSVDSLI